MASLRQIAANQKNAQKSTGPKTDEGKDASRRNAVKHGLAGAGVILPGDDEAAIETRKAEWRPHYLVETPEEIFLFEQMVTSAVRLDRCRLEEIQIRLTESQHAALSWDDDRHDEAAEIAGKLSKKPVQVSRRLQRTRQGVEWMIERWQDLADVLDAGGMWTEAQTTLALDLMGTPLEFRDLLEPIESPASLAARQILHLERRKVSALDTYDDQERDAALRGIPYEPSRVLKNLRRYEATCMRTFLWASNQLKPNRQTPEPTPPQPIPPTTPEPQDDPEPQDYPAFSGRMVIPTFAPTNRAPENRRARRAAAKLARRRCA